MDEIQGSRVSTHRSVPTEPWGQGQTTLGRGKGGRPVGGRSPNGAHEEGEQDMEDQDSPNAMGHILPHTLSSTF